MNCIPCGVIKIKAAETTHCGAAPKQLSGGIGIGTLQSDQLSGGMGTPNAFAMFFASSLERSRFIIGVVQHRNRVCMCHIVCVCVCVSVLRWSVKESLLPKIEMSTPTEINHSI